MNSSPPSRASVSPGRNAALEPARRRDQELVTDLVPQAVIDRLETIEIEVEHREPRIAQRAPGAVKQVLQPVEEQRAVREIGERIVERLVLQLLLGLLALGDVARDPEGPHDVPLPIAQRKLRRRDPAELAGRQRLLLLHVHERLAGANDLLLVAQRLRRVLVGEEVEVGPTDGERRVGEAEPRRLISVDAGEAALAILEVDAVEEVVHQRLQQEGRVLAFGNLRDDINGRLGVGRLVLDRLGARPQPHRGLSSAPSLRRPIPLELVSTNTRYYQPYSSAGRNPCGNRQLQRPTWRLLAHMNPNALSVRRPGRSRAPHQGAEA